MSTTKPPSTTRLTKAGRTYRARVTAGPRDGRWRWRREERTSSGWRSHGTVWAKAEEGSRLLRDLHRSLQAEGPIDRAQTMHDLFSMWLAEQEARHDLKHRSVLAYQAAVNHLGDERRGLRMVAPTHLTRRHLGHWLRRSQDLGYADITIAGDLRILRFVWAWGQEQGDIPRDLELPKLHFRAQAKPRHTPTPHEVAVVLGKLEHETTRRMLILARATGARRDEVRTLRWCDVVLMGNEARLRFDGKTGRRETPVGAHTTAALERWRKADDAGPSDHVLHRGHQAPTAPHLRRHLNMAIDAAEQPRWSWHSLRRLAVMEMLRAGIDPGAAASITGHSVEVMFRYYREITADDQRRAAQVLDAQVIEVDFAARSRAG